MAYLKKLWAITLLFVLIWGCSDEDLKSIRLQTPTAHLLQLPVNSDTTQVFEVSSDIWLTVWDSIRQEAGIDQSHIQEAVPLLVTATLLEPDSTFEKLEQFDIYTLSNGSNSLLLSSLPEDTEPSGTEQELFPNPINHLDNFLSESPSLLLRYQVREPRDTLWTIGLQVTWEMRGTWD